MMPKYEVNKQSVNENNEFSPEVLTTPGKQIVYIKSLSDPTFSLKLIAAQLAKARTIRDCNSLFAAGGTGGSTLPWWYIIASELLSNLYLCDSIIIQQEYTAKFIAQLTVKSIAANDHYYIAKDDKLKVVDAMGWIHENCSLDGKNNYDYRVIVNSITFIRNYIVRNVL